MKYYDKINIAARYLLDFMFSIPETAIILGTGLSSLREKLVVEHRIPYSDIPHFPTSTVESHAGELLMGTIDGKPVLMLAGRFHYYEGYSMKEVTFPVRVLKELGVENLFITNAAGGLDPEYNAGDIVIIRDHINMMPENPLRGKNDDRLGLRFPDMKDAYAPNLIARAISIASNSDITIRQGVYCALPGPNLETPAEYNMLRIIGADLVGMSTVPEVIVGVHAGLNIFAASIVSNVCYPIDRITKTTLEEVIEVTQKSGDKLSNILSELL